MKLQLQVSKNAPIDDYYELVAVITISNKTTYDSRDKSTGLVPLGLSTYGDRLLYITSLREIDNHQLSPVKLKTFINDYLTAETPMLLDFEKENNKLKVIHTLVRSNSRRHFLLIKYGKEYGLTTISRMNTHTYGKPIHRKLGKQKNSVDILDYCALLKKG